MISLCIIAKNNEKTLANCISSVKNIVNEIVMVDTGSNDKTKEIALALGARVYYFEWRDDFSKAKNYAISKASHDWILNLDADETIAASDLIELKKISESNEYDGYYLIQRNYTNEMGSFGWVSSKDDAYEESKAAKGFVPREMLRLFRNDKKIKFEGKIHDSPIKSIERIGGKIGGSKIAIHHFGLLGRDKDRLRWYVDLEKKKIMDDFFQEYQIASQLHSLGDLNWAIKHLKRSIELNPRFHLSLLELGIISIKKGKVIEAKPLLIKSLELKQHEMTWNHLGIIEAYEKKYERAIKCFEKAVQMNSKNADFHFNLGQALKQAGNIDKAKEEFEKAVYLNEDYKDKIS